MTERLYYVKCIIPLRDEGTSQMSEEISQAAVQQAEMNRQFEATRLRAYPQPSLADVLAELKALREEIASLRECYVKLANPLVAVNGSLPPTAFTSD